MTRFYKTIKSEKTSYMDRYIRSAKETGQKPQRQTEKN